MYRVMVRRRGEQAEVLERTGSWFSAALLLRRHAIEEATLPGMANHGTVSVWAEEERRGHVKVHPPATREEGSADGRAD